MPLISGVGKIAAGNLFSVWCKSQLWGQERSVGWERRAGRQDSSLVPQRPGLMVLQVLVQGPDTGLLGLADRLAISS